MTGANGALDRLARLAPLLWGLGAGLLVRHYLSDDPAWLHAAIGFGVALLAWAADSFPHAKPVQFFFENQVFFMSGVVLALVWANVHPDSYRRLTEPFHFVVNDVLMAFFFGLAAKEVREALLPGGPLSSFKKAAMPLVATLGGMTAPVAIFALGALVLGRPELVKGWAIPTATDIAFCALLARFVFGGDHPAIPFLLLLAIADDAGGLAILAVAYPQHELRLGLLAGLLALGIAAGLVLNRLGVQRPWAYILLAGVPAWFALHEGGVHPALALVPIIPTLPHHRSDTGIFVEDAHEDTSALHGFAKTLSAPVSLILGFFALVNAGVPLRGFGPATWLVLAGLVVGKPLGIVLFVLLGRAFGLALPEGLGLREVLVLGFAAGIGFTVALFVATVALGGGADLDAAKMGALGSIVAAPLAVLLGKLLGVRKRAPPSSPAPAPAG